MTGVHVADCLDGLANLDAASVDLVFADLPYGSTQNAWDELIPCEKLWPALARVCKPNAAMVFTAIQPFTSLLVCSNLGWFRYSMVWRKNKSSGALNANRRPLRAHEDILIFWRETPRYNLVMSDGHEPSHGAHRHTSQGVNYGRTSPGTTTYRGGMTVRYPTTVLDIPVVNNDDPERIHPTQKPVELPAWFIKAYTTPGDVILDPTAGSGTTLVAAKALGRRYVGFDSDPRMAELANRRIMQTPQGTSPVHLTNHPVWPYLVRYAATNSDLVLFPSQLREAVLHENVVTNCPACHAVARPFTIVPGRQELAITPACPRCAKSDAAMAHWSEMQARLVAEQRRAA